jgi:cell pole-organizing protein PopZ
MEAKKQEAGLEDLSMQDILQSIRRIIADESTEAKTEAAAPISPVGDVASDILELTDLLEEDGTVTDLTAVSDVPVEETANLDDIFASFDAKEEPEISAETILAEPSPPPPAVAMPTPVERKITDDEIASLLSKNAEAAAISALDKLKSPELHPPLLHPPSPVFRSGMTVEDMVADMLHPMLREWVDANLPAIVERIVEREILRLTQR